MSRVTEFSVHFSNNFRPPIEPLRIVDLLGSTCKGHEVLCLLFISRNSIDSYSYAIAINRDFMYTWGVLKFVACGYNIDIQRSIFVNEFLNEWRGTRSKWSVSPATAESGHLATALHAYWPWSSLYYTTNLVQSAHFTQRNGKILKNRRFIILQRIRRSRWTGRAKYRTIIQSRPICSLIRSLEIINDTRRMAENLILSFLDRGIDYSGNFHAILRTIVSFRSTKQICVMFWLHIWHSDYIFLEVVVSPQSHPKVHSPALSLPTWTTFTFMKKWLICGIQSENNIFLNKIECFRARRVITWNLRSFQN